MTVSVFSSCQALNPMKPTSSATISTVPMRNDLSVMRDTTSRRVTSTQAGSVPSVRSVWLLMLSPPGRSR